MAMPIELFLQGTGAGDSSGELKTRRANLEFWLQETDKLALRPSNFGGTTGRCDSSNG